MIYIEKLSYCAFIGCLLLPQAVIAKQADLAEKVKACSEVASNQARLSCFDQLTAKQDTKAESPKTSGLKATGLKTELSAAQVDQFSKEQLEKTAEEKANEVRSISLTISKLEKTQRKQWKITFANGQQWLQKDNTKLKLKQGEQVMLSKGAISSVFLEKENSNKRIKVKRLK